MKTKTVSKNLVRVIEMIALLTLMGTGEVAFQAIVASFIFGFFYMQIIGTALAPRSLMAIDLSSLHSSP